MELNNWIGQDITHINSTALLYNLGVFLEHQPANVSEEKATITIMRISVSLRVW